MNVIFKSVHKFDLVRIKPVEIPLLAEQVDFNDYLQQLIEEVIADDRGRKYLFPKDSTAIMATIDSVVSAKNASAATLDAAKRLLRIEEEVQGRIEHLRIEVQRGILIQALVDLNGQQLFLIIKAEHAEFINENDNKRATGLPIKKKIFKSVCIYLGQDQKPTHAMVTDYRTSISTYWWHNFLELEEEYTNEQNTERSIDVLDRKIFSGMKKEHPADYMNLRNATTAYFRTHNEFVMADYLDTVIKPYRPEDASLDVPGLSGKIDALPEKGKFDRRFDIVAEKLKNRIVTRLRLTPVLELVIKENINLKDDITAYEEKGVKYISIRTDEGYKYFNKDQ